MIIALLAVLGVDLIVIIVLLAAVLTRRRWIKHQPGSFKGAIRIVDGDIKGFKTKWKRGYGRWVSNVLIWTKAPFLFRNEVLVGEPRPDEIRAAEPKEIRRLGKHPEVLPVVVDGGGRMEVATPQGEKVRASGDVAAGSGSVAEASP